MDGGAWRATVHGVAKSRTRLSDLTFTFFLRAAAYCFSTLSVSNPSQENIPPLNLIHLSCFLLAFHVAAPTANDDTCLYDTRGLMGKVTCSCAPLPTLRRLLLRAPANHLPHRSLPQHINWDTPQ